MIVKYPTLIFDNNKNNSRLNISSSLYLKYNLKTFHCYNLPKNQSINEVQNLSSPGDCGKQSQFQQKHVQPSCVASVRKGVEKIVVVGKTRGI